MEIFEQKLAEADKRIYVADHMLSSTYPLLRDPKLLIGVLENVYSAFKNTISALLEHERYFKRIPPYNRATEIVTFKAKASKYEFSKYIQTYDRLSEAVEFHKTAPIEFSRNESYIMASDTYSLKKLSTDDLKKDIKTCREFIAGVKKIIVRKNVA